MRTCKTVSAVYFAAGLLFLLLAVDARANATYEYIGSWDLARLPGQYSRSNSWAYFNNPRVYSGVDAAAMLFGGRSSDYAISTVDNNPLHINHKAYVDGWGDISYLLNPASESFSKGTHYEDHPGVTGSAYSAYVVDNAPVTEPYRFINYVFRLEAVPESDPLITLIWLAPAGVLLLQKRRLRP